MVQKRTVARFEAWVKEPAGWDAFFALLEGRDGAEPLTFRDACFHESIKLPYTLMHAHVNATPELRARYDAVLAAKADGLVHEALADVEEATDIPSATVARVKSDVKLKVAGKWDRQRYGDAKEGGAGGITVMVDRSCGGNVQIGVQDGRGNKAAIQVSGAEASTLPAAISKGG